MLIWQHCTYVPYFKSTKVINVFFFQERLFFLVFFEWKQIFANSTNTQKRAKSLTQSLTPKLWRPTNNWRQKATTLRSKRGEGGRRRRTVCDKGRRLRTSTVKVRAPSWSAPFFTYIHRDEIENYSYQWNSECWDELFQSSRVYLPAQYLQVLWQYL